MFLHLGVAMGVLGGLGLVLAVLVDDRWGGAAAVLAGLAMTGLVGLDARRAPDRVGPA